MATQEGIPFFEFVDRFSKGGDVVDGDTHGILFQEDELSFANDDAGDFKTRASTPMIALINRMRMEGKTLKLGYLQRMVFVIRKRRGSPWSSRISVGRAPNVDIQIRDSSVSKLHAHITEGDAGFNKLVDVGSTNGTSVNDQRLPEKGTYMLANGDVITFGSRNFRYFTTEEFVGLVTRQVGG